MNLFKTTDAVFKLTIQTPITVYVYCKSSAIFINIKSIPISRDICPLISDIREPKNILRSIKVINTPVITAVIYVLHKKFPLSNKSTITLIRGYYNMRGGAAVKTFLKFFY